MTYAPQMNLNALPRSYQMHVVLIAQSVISNVGNPLHMHH